MFGLITSILFFSIYCDPIAGQCQRCPDGWVYFQNSCYMFSGNTNKDWSESAHWCSLHHESRLVLIETEAENDFLKDMINQLKEPGPYWTGASDSAVEHVWEWYPDIIPVTYTDWFPGEPNAFHGHDEDCMELRTAHNNTWNDAPCSQKCRPLCEYQLTDDDNLFVGK